MLRSSRYTKANSPLEGAALCRVPRHGDPAVFHPGAVLQHVGVGGELRGVLRPLEGEHHGLVRQPQQGEQLLLVLRHIVGGHRRLCGRPGPAGGQPPGTGPPPQPGKAACSSVSSQVLLLCGHGNLQAGVRVAEVIPQLLRQGYADGRRRVPAGVEPPLQAVEKQCAGAAQRQPLPAVFRLGVYLNLDAAPGTRCRRKLPPPTWPSFIATKPQPWAAYSSQLPNWAQKSGPSPAPAKRGTALQSSAASK